MKEAMWGVGLIMLAIFGILLINLFGSITVTNQQDYTALKNTVEAAMYDAIDDGLYRSGFCVCTNIEKDNNGKYTFNTSSDYEIGSLKDGVCYPKDNSLMTNCEPIEGEYIINKKVFAESLVRRLSESVKANNDYQLIINDVIEYPPKVSVNIKSSNAYDIGEGNYTIDNKIDAILEMDSNQGVETHYEVKDNTCLANDIKCNSITRECRDSSGNLCGNLPKPTTYKSCEKIGECKETRNNTVVCYDERGNECSRVTVTIPQIPNIPPQPNVPSTTVSQVQTAVVGCFLAGTKIMTKEGYTDIDKLKIGDYVLTYNEEKNINEYKKISHVFIFEDLDEELYTVKTMNTEFSLTGHHRVYTKRDGKYEYIAAMDLNIGDTVKYSDGNDDIVTEIKHEKIHKTVYNLEVEDNHNFYVGDKGILVHNAACGPYDGQGCNRAQAFK